MQLLPVFYYNIQVWRNFGDLGTAADHNTTSLGEMLEITVWLFPSAAFSDTRRF